MQKILRMISSRRLAIVLLILTIISSILGTTFFDGQKLGDYANSWWFILVLTFLLLSTMTCTINRIKAYKSKEKLLKNWNLDNFESKIITNKGIFEGYSTIDAELRKYNYKTQLKQIDSSTIRIFGIKGQMGFWGSIIFHGSFLIISFGVIISLLFRFSGEFILVEGETFNDIKDGYMNIETGLFSRNHHGQFQFQFKKFEPIVSNNKKLQSSEQYSEDYISSIAIFDNYQLINAARLGVNQKAKYKGYSINPDYYGHGYAPKLQVTRNPGRGNEKNNQETILDSFLVLNTTLHESFDQIAKIKSNVTYSDEIDIADLNWKLKINFFPNKPKSGENIVDSSPFPDNPMLSLKIINLKDGNLVYQGVVDLSEPVTINSYTLEFTEVKHWQRFFVRRDRGQGIVYLGFFVGIVGLVLRFTQHRRVIQGLVKLEEKQTLIYLKEILENKSFQKPELEKIMTSIGGINHE